MSPFLDWMVPLAPEVIVILAALAALALDFAIVRRRTLAFRARVVGTVTCLGCVAAMIWIACGHALPAAEMLALTPLTQYLKLVLLGLTFVVAVLSFSARFSRHIGEYFALLLIAAAGMMLLISSENLLMIFLALEMLSLPLYVLTAFNKSSPASAEAALKYFLFGSVAAAFTLFGISLLYGMTGELQLGAVAETLRKGPIEPVCYVALVMTLAGFAFKVALAPFHFWTPDVYEGRRPPSPVSSRPAPRWRASLCWPESYWMDSARGGAAPPGRGFRPDGCRCWRCWRFSPLSSATSPPWCRPA